MFKLLQRTRADEDGATMVEYALMIAFVAAVVVVAVHVFGTTVQSLLQTASNAVAAAID